MSEQEDVFNGLGIEVDIFNKDNFLKIAETLTRIGYASKDKKLFQSAHILHKRGHYSIMHFKELFILDGKETDISENDLERRNTIARLLEDWGLLQINNPDKVLNEAAMGQIKIISHADKKNWELVPKYSIGNRK